MFQKYGAALISIALVAFAFLKTAFGDDVLDAAETWQLAALVAGAIATYLLPLVPIAWAGALKTGAAALAALATAIVPFALQGTLTFEQITIVALAVLNALGVEVGVQARVSSIRPVIDGGIAAPGQPATITSVTEAIGEHSVTTTSALPAALALDPEGVRALTAR